jgi:uncharacterized protein
MKIMIAGGSGSIGRSLTKELISHGHTVIILTRYPSNENTNGIIFVKWDGHASGDWCRSLENCDAVVNLSGASIAGGRWTKKRKTELIASRVTTTRALVQAISQTTSHLPVFINASAVGYYGDTGDNIVNENFPNGKGFLAELCNLWEKEALKVKEYGVRVALLRTGVVLDKNSGALKKMTLPFKLFIGGRLGSGSQWIPWIHIEDVVNAIVFIIETRSRQGPIDLTSPQPVTMDVFAKKLGSVLHRPSWFPVPTFILKILLGEMSSVLLEGQRALPEKLIAAGFKFKYPCIDEALIGIFDKQK